MNLLTKISDSLKRQMGLRQQSAFKEMGGLNVGHGGFKGESIKPMSGFAKRHRSIIKSKKENQSGKTKSHPGFAAVQSKIEHEGFSHKIAGAILASRTRNASASAHRANPHLNRVKG